MKICLIANHNWPVQPVALPPYTGDFFYALLAKGLDELGHEVTFVAPRDSYRPPHGVLVHMPCAFGKYPPTAHDCEGMAYNNNRSLLAIQDVVCDFSTNKTIAEHFVNTGRTNVCSLIMGGSWAHPNPRHNIICQSEAQKQRGLKGETDYANTLVPEMGGPPQEPIQDARVIHDGIDTDYYTPGDGLMIHKEAFYLWSGRWHPVRGYKEAIEIAKRTGINLVLAGENPEEALVSHQAECAREALQLAQGCANISFEWLPANEEHHRIKRRLLQQAKGYLLTTQFQEPFGLSQVEALACGTPCIATNYGSMPEVLGDCGILVNNSVEDFIAHLPELESISSEQCRERAVKYFDYRVMAANYLQLFEKIRQGETW